MESESIVPHEPREYERFLRILVADLTAAGERVLASVICSYLAACLGDELATFNVEARRMAAAVREQLQRKASGRGE